MSKKCPDCGKIVGDDTHFCSDCGYNFQDLQSSAAGVSNMPLFSKIFIVLIAFVVVVGALTIFSMGSSVNDSVESVPVSDSPVDDADVEMTISGVSGYYYNYTDGDMYDLITSALFTELPDDLNGYVVKTTYYDDNNTRIGQNTDLLSNIIYDEDDYSDYPVSFGIYNSHQKLNPDHVVVEITKSGKTFVNSTYEIDKNSIEYL